MDDRIDGVRLADHHRLKTRRGTFLNNVARSRWSRGFVDGPVSGRGMHCERMRVAKRGRFRWWPHFSGLLKLPGHTKLIPCPWLLGDPRSGGRTCLGQAGLAGRYEKPRSIGVYEASTGWTHDTGRMRGKSGLCCETRSCVRVGNAADVV
eukprot:363371-Chlamydomonas_euryale.AAC.18